MNVIKTGRESAKEQLRNKRTTMRKNEAATVLELTRNWLEGKRVFSMVELDFLAETVQYALRRCGTDAMVHKNTSIACLDAFAKLYQACHGENESKTPVDDLTGEQYLYDFYPECRSDENGNDVTPHEAAMLQIEYTQDQQGEYINTPSAESFAKPLAMFFSEQLQDVSSEQECSMSGETASQIIEEHVPALLHAAIAAQSELRGIFIESLKDSMGDIKIDNLSVQNDLCRAFIPMYGFSVASGCPGLTVMVNIEIGDNAEMSFIASDPAKINYLEDMFERMLSKDELSPFFCSDPRWNWSGMGLMPDDSVHLGMTGLSVWVPREKIEAAIKAFRELMDQPDVQKAREQLKWVYGRI
jgi:hypothetical protein